MTEAKKVIRDVTDDAKEAWRKADGDESVGDRLANAGDRLRHGAENVGDEVHEKVDDAGRALEYERGRVDERSRQEDLESR
jgi:hypothetical protein